MRLILVSGFLLFLCGAIVVLFAGISGGYLYLFEGRGATMLKIAAIAVLPTVVGALVAMGAAIIDIWRSR